MDSINFTIYLLDDVVSGPVCMLQVVYLDSNTLITAGCQPVESPGIDNLAESCVFPSGRKKSFGISHCIADCLLASGSGGKLNKLIETLLFVREEQANFWLICVFFNE